MKFVTDLENFAQDAVNLSIICFILFSLPVFVYVIRKDKGACVQSIGSAYSGVWL